MCIADKRTNQKPQINFRQRIATLNKKSSTQFSTLGIPFTLYALRSELLHPQNLCTYSFIQETLQWYRTLTHHEFSGAKCFKLKMKMCGCLPHTARIQNPKIPKWLPKSPFFS
jgi:hypothetical protein